MIAVGVVIARVMAGLTKVRNRFDDSEADPLYISFVGKNLNLTVQKPQKYHISTLHVILSASPFEASTSPAITFGFRLLVWTILPIMSSNSDNTRLAGV